MIIARSWWHRCHELGLWRDRKLSRPKKLKRPSMIDPNLRVGDRVMVHNPGEVKGKAWKLARPNNAEVVLVDRPQDPAIFVSLDHVRPCYAELSDTLWTGRKRRKRSRRKNEVPPQSSEQVSSEQRKGPMTRSRTRQGV